MEDGSTVDIGNLVLDTNTYYTVTNNLINCTNGNSATQAVGGESYSATIAANDGYDLSSVVVTMGGTDITASAVSGGTISIASVTGDIVITAVAEEKTVEIVNLAEPNTTNTTDWSIWCNSSRISSAGEYRSATGLSTTNYIECTNTDELYIKGMTFTADTHTMCAYNSDKRYIHNGTPAFWDGSNQIATITTEGDVTHIKFNGKNTQYDSGLAFVRLSGALTGSANDVIITKNQPIS
jgi:hypothetical protein